MDAHRTMRAHGARPIRSSVATSPDLDTSIDAPRGVADFHLPRKPRFLWFNGLGLNLAPTEAPET